MNFNKVYCLFEQSGTFRDRFKSLGYKSYSYDIAQDKNDFQVDIFKEIEKAFVGLKSIFDTFTSNDLLLAFFPCTYFSGQNNLIWSRKLKAFENWSNEKIDNYIINRKEKRAYFLNVFSKLVCVCKERNLQLIVENPNSGNYLLNFYKPSLIINDRTKFGDKFKKPTLFFFINCEPENNFIDFKEYNGEYAKINDCHGIERSYITPEFTENFIKKFILDGIKQLDIFNILN